jgi:C4-type Zn-finger protein
MSKSVARFTTKDRRERRGTENLTLFTKDKSGRAVIAKAKPTSPWIKADEKRTIPHQ